MNNNPINNMDPEGDFFWAAVGLSAAFGGISGSVTNGWKKRWMS